jgi:hypothetical protein
VALLAARQRRRRQHHTASANTADAGLDPAITDGLTRDE